MQALVIAQARACAQRARMLSEEKTNQKQSTYRKNTEANLFMHMYNVSSKLLVSKKKSSKLLITIFQIVVWFFLIWCPERWWLVVPNWRFFY
jgi:hypothetical protein